MYNGIINSKVIYNDMYKRYVELYVTVDAKRAPKSGLHIFSCCVGCSVRCLGYWRLSHVIWRLRFEVTLHKSRSLRDSVFVEIKHF